MCKSILKQSKCKEISRSSIYCKEVVEGSGMLENSSWRNVDCVLDGRYSIAGFVVRFILSVSFFRMEKCVNHYCLNIM